MTSGVTPANHYIPRHIAVFNHSTLVDDRDVAFHVAAVDKQLREHIAPLWDMEAPGVMFYGHADRIPADQAALLGVVDDDGDAEAAGYHSQMGDRIYGLVDAGQSPLPEVTMSHEAGEMYGNAELKRLAPGPNDRSYFVELMDVCQRDTYLIEVTLMGETRMVTVSDFAMPAWFGLPNVFRSDKRTTYLDRHRLAPFEIAPGGYQVVQEANGSIQFLSRGAMGMNFSPHGRTHRIWRKHKNLVRTAAAG